MIEIKLTGKCAGCPCCDAVISTMYGDGMPVLTGIRCEHQELCDRLEAYLAGVADMNVGNKTEAGE